MVVIECVEEYRGADVVLRDVRARGLEADDDVASIRERIEVCGVGREELEIETSLRIFLFIRGHGIGEVMCDQRIDRLTCLSFCLASPRVLDIPRAPLAPDLLEDLDAIDRPIRRREIIRDIEGDSSSPLFEREHSAPYPSVVLPDVGKDEPLVEDGMHPSSRLTSWHEERSL